MKKILGVIVLFGLILTFVVPCHSQVVVLEKDIYTTTAVKRFTATAGGTISGIVYVTSDSTVDIPIKEAFDIEGKVRNVFPDSIHWIWYAKGTTTTDSVGLYLTLQARVNGGVNRTRVPVDSILASEDDYKTLDGIWYHGMDYLTVTVKSSNIAGEASKNQYKTNGGSTLILRQKRYFRLR